MAGSVFMPGEQKVRPGVYVRVTNRGLPTEPGLAQGIVAVPFRASWGPLGEQVLLESPDSVTQLFGSDGTVHALLDAFLGGARQVLGYRMGRDGQTASTQLQGQSGPVVTITARYPGARGNSLSVTVRDSLTAPGQREMVVYEGTTRRQTITYEPGTNEAAALAAAVSESGSEWITATATGSGSVTAVTQQALTGGADPVITGEDYAEALAAIEALDWNVLAVDTNDVAVHATVAAYIDRLRDDGKRVLCVVGEPTSVALETRLANAAAFNDPAVVYVANGLRGLDGVIREGYRAAALVAGIIASEPVTTSFTHYVVPRMTEVVGALTNAQIERAIRSGALVFTVNAARQVQIEYGINTLVTLGADQDAGWRKIRRMRTRDNLIERCVAVTDPLIGRVTNSPDGRAALIAAMQGVVDAMTREGALLGGTVREDPANPAQGDSAWFSIEVDDLDSAEKLYLTFGFRFAPEG